MLRCLLGGFHGLPGASLLATLAIWNNWPVANQEAILISYDRQSTFANLTPCSHKKMQLTFDWKFTALASLIFMVYSVHVFPRKRSLHTNWMQGLYFKQLYLYIYNINTITIYLTYIIGIFFLYFLVGTFPDSSVSIREGQSWNRVHPEFKVHDGQSPCKSHQPE